MLFIFLQRNARVSRVWCYFKGISIITAASPCSWGTGHSNLPPKFSVCGGGCTGYTRIYLHCLSVCGCTGYACIYAHCLRLLEKFLPHLNHVVFSNTRTSTWSALPHRQHIQWSYKKKAVTFCGVCPSLAPYKWARH